MIRKISRSSRSSICFYFQIVPYSNFPSIQVSPFDILTFFISDNFIFHWKTVLRKWASSSSSCICIYFTTNRFVLEPLNAVFCEELFGVTIIWPFKSFMRPVLPLAVVGGTNKLCRIPTAFTPRREKRAFTGPPIILHLLPLHSNTSLDLVVRVQIVESECGGRVYCVFGAKGLTPGSPRASHPTPTSHPLLQIHSPAKLHSHHLIQLIRLPWNRSSIFILFWLACVEI